MQTRARCHMLIFQFTPLREGRRGSSSFPWTSRHFNSRPCGRGDNILEQSPVAGNISIHAPAGGATFFCEYGFQFDFISIHAPAGGATQPDTMFSSLKIFQFTPLREGRRTIGTRFMGTAYKFQFTPLREGRPPSCATGHYEFYFNSRPCGRGDSKRVQKKKMTIVPFAEKRGKFILL